MSDDYTFNLGDFAPVPVTVEIQMNYGRTLTVRLMPLSAAQWTKIGEEVKATPAPESKNPFVVADWKASVDTAEDERSYRRLVTALEGGGSKLEGETLSEKVASLKRSMDNGIAMSLWQWLLAASSGGKVRVVSAPKGETETT